MQDLFLVEFTTGEVGDDATGPLEQERLAHPAGPQVGAGLRHEPIDEVDAVGTDEFDGEGFNADARSSDSRQGIGEGRDGRL